MPQIEQYPQNPDEVSRLAGKDIYECSVGVLRRAELWRLGNAWGLTFPVGCSKDYMLPFFKQLEAEGKNPLRPPGKHLDALVKDRAVEHSKETHAERDDVDAVLKPRETPQITADLAKLPIGKIRKLCKEYGLSQTIHDRKKDLIARLLDKIEGPNSGNDTSDSG